MKNLNSNNLAPNTDSNISAIADRQELLNQVFWDGYGLNHRNSGIFNYARCLAEQLIERGVKITAIQSALGGFPLAEGVSSLTLQPIGSLNQRLFHSKLVWPNHVGNQLLKAIREQQAEQRGSLDSRRSENEDNSSSPTDVNTNGNVKIPVRQGGVANRERERDRDRDRDRERERDIFAQITQHKPIYHGLCNANLPLSSKFFDKFHTVLTIHDVIPLIARGQVSFASYCQFTFYLGVVAKKVDRIVCVSEWTRDLFLQHYPQLRDKTSVIISGFHPVDILPTAMPLANKIRILFVSRFEKYKRFEVLAKLIRSCRDKFQLTIITNDIGVAWLNENLKDVIEAGDLLVKSKLNLEDLRKEYQKSEVYVHPSRYEGFCLPASEAIAFGRPVVYTVGSGIDEVVPDEVGIGLPENASIADWADSIEEVYKRSRSPQFSDLIRSKIEEKATWHTAATELFRVYKSFT